MTVRFNTADVDDLNLFYREAGDASRPTVLLLHGFPSASQMFRDLIPELADYYHVIAPDLPGFGMTQQPARDQFGYNFENIANVIDRYELSQLGIEVVLVQPSAYPTNMYAVIQQPADAAMGEAYGEIGTIPGKMFETFVGLFQSDAAPDPHDVSKAIAALVAAPKGERPARTVVGTAFGADVANAATAPAQQGALDALGLGFLATIA